MKKIIPIIIVLIIAVVAAVIFFGVRAVKMNEYKNNINIPENFTITAHTGCMKTEENSAKQQ